jgi:rhodanese-related sulfurtransferase
LTVFLLPVTAGAATPPLLSTELAACQQAHPAAPVTSNFDGEPLPMHFDGATTVNSAVAACLIKSMGQELVVIAPMGEEQGIADAYPIPGLGTKIALSAEQKETIADAVASASGRRKDRPLLVYCHHTSCPLSYQALAYLKNAGYTRLIWLREGLTGWRAAGLPLGPTRKYGLPSLPNVVPPAPKFDVFGDPGYPIAPDYFEKRYDALAEVGLQQKRLCLILGMGMKSDDPAAAGSEFRGIAMLLKAAGVDPATDNDVQISRKMVKFWERYGSLVECKVFENSVSAFKAMLYKGRSELLEAALTWRLPESAWNKIDADDGETVLDFVGALYHEREPGDTRRNQALSMYRSLVKAGAKTRSELEREGKAESAEALQRKLLPQLRRQAEAGSIKAMLQLSRIYRYGQYVPVNRDEGMKWWRSAEDRALATKDFATMAWLGSIYGFQPPAGHKPGDIDADGVKARQWLRRAADGGDDDAIMWLSKLYIEGVGGPVERQRGIDEFKRLLVRGENHRNGDEAVYWIALAYAREGDYVNIAPYLRSIGMGRDIDGVEVEQIFVRKKIPFCGPRIFGEEIVCNGKNFLPPDLRGD